MDVYLHRQLVGSLIQDEHGDMVFEYSAQRLTDDSAIPLSQSLPLRQERYEQNECAGFFGGILPDGDKREILAKEFSLSAKNDYSMLELIGGECAGAVTFVPSGEKLPADEERYRPLTNHELAKALRELPSRPLLANGEDIRISLAGAQDKIAVHISDNQIYIPLAGAMSTHIIKPESAHVDDIVFNELLCMKLATAIGLQAAEVELGNTDGINYLLVKRYDRTSDEAAPLSRLHQEDFCQAMGVFSKNKYQYEGGPTLEQSFALVGDVSSIPVIDLRSLLDGVIFNFLIGNNDAHGKNYSLLYFGHTKFDLETRLAPLYDLLSTVYHFRERSSRMAMKIGGEYESDKIYPRHFERLADEANLGKPMVLRRVIELAKLVMSTLPGVTRDDAASIKVAKLIRGRCERTIDRFQR
jgi:serine/threonine-protein kinase HipA